MQVLVTGSNGLLGANLCRALLAEGHSVRALVRTTSDTRALDGLDVDRVHGDVRDSAAMRRAVEGCEIVYHCAAVFSYWGYSPEEMQNTAKQGTAATIRAAKEAGVRRLVLTSSTAIFGGSDEPVALSEDHASIDDQGPDYFRSKAMQERVAFETAEEVDLECVAVLPSIILGPFDFKPSQSLATITGYLGDPLKLTYPGGANLVHAEDVARAHIIAGEKGEPGARYISSAFDAEWTEIHKLISKLTGTAEPRMRVGRRSAYLGAMAMEAAAKITKKPPLGTRALAGQVGRYFWYSHRKLAALGYTPRPLEETLADTLGWLLTSPHITAKEAKKLELAPPVLAARERYLALANAA